MENARAARGNRRCQDHFGQNEPRHDYDQAEGHQVHDLPHGQVHAADQHIDPKKDPVDSPFNGYG
jgi:hypothetical protein